MLNTCTKTDWYQERTTRFNTVGWHQKNRQFYSFESSNSSSCIRSLKLM